MNLLYSLYKLLFIMAYHVYITLNNLTNTYSLHLLYLDIDIFDFYQVVITTL